MSTEDNKALIRRIVDGLSQKDVTVLDELCTPNFVFHDPANPQVRSLEDFKQLFAGMCVAFPDLHFSLEDMLAEEDKVAYRYTFHAIQSGSWRDMAPTGKPISFTAIAISRIVDGKSAEVWQNTDALGLLQQLGVVPTMG